MLNHYSWYMTRRSIYYLVAYTVRSLISTLVSPALNKSQPISLRNRLEGGKARPSLCGVGIRSRTGEPRGNPPSPYGSVGNAVPRYGAPQRLNSAIVFPTCRTHLSWFRFLVCRSGTLDCGLSRTGCWTHRFRSRPAICQGYWPLTLHFSLC